MDIWGPLRVKILSEFLSFHSVEALETYSCLHISVTYRTLIMLAGFRDTTNLPNIQFSTSFIPVPKMQYSSSDQTLIFDSWSGKSAIRASNLHSGRVLHICIVRGNEMANLHLWQGEALQRIPSLYHEVLEVSYLDAVFELLADNVNRCIIRMSTKLLCTVSHPD